MEEQIVPEASVSSMLQCPLVASSPQIAQTWRVQWQSRAYACCHRISGGLYDGGERQALDQDGSEVVELYGRKESSSTLARHK